MNQVCYVWSKPGVAKSQTSGDQSTGSHGKIISGTSDPARTQKRGNTCAIFGRLDGVVGSGLDNDLVGRDAYGLSLTYHGNDYRATDNVRWDNTNAHRPFAPQAWTTPEWHPLYNGNIATTVNSLEPFGVGGWQGTTNEVGQVLAGLYRYDQLNRLRQMRTRAGLNSTANDWTTLPTPTGADADKYLSTYEYDANGNIEAANRYDQNGDHYDELEYFYHKNGSELVRNRLYHLKDHADATNAYVNEGPSGAVDLDHRQATYFPDINDINEDNNYRYDELGNLIQDKEEEIGGIDWTVAGKVKAITRPGGSTLEPMEFAYGASGQRTEKTVGAGAGLTREHYVRDAQGSVMAIYRHEPGGGSFTLKERDLYGSSRLGRYVEEVEFIPPPTIPQTQAADDRRLHYEMTDHLGNVNTVVTGRLLIGDGAPHEAQVLSAQGYEPGGSLLPGRNYSSSSYDYGFNGMRKDDEIHGATGTSYDFGARLYDPRVGRWLSLDPLAKKYPNVSPYVFAEGNPIYFNDPTGKDAEVTIVGNTITIRAVINIYGSGATAAVASQMQSDIMGAWATNGGEAWTYTDPGTGSVYNVKFDVTVQLYKGQEGIDPFVIPESWNPSNTENFIEVGDDVGRSYVMGGDEGSWRSKGRGDLSLAEDDSAPHEFGHLLGLADRYNKKGPKAGWEGNIMAEPAMAGAVEQRNIDAIVAPVLKGFNDAKQMDAALTEAGPRAVGRLGFVPVNGAYQEYKKTGTYKTKIDDCCDK